LPHEANVETAVNIDCATVWLFGWHENDEETLLALFIYVNEDMHLKYAIHGRYKLNHRAFQLINTMKQTYSNFVE
jgi:hypothetical protein